MTDNELTEIQEHKINGELMYIAFEILEKVKHSSCPEGLIEGWIEEIREEANFQFAHAREKKEMYL